MNKSIIIISFKILNTYSHPIGTVSATNHRREESEREDLRGINSQECISVEVRGQVEEILVDLVPNRKCDPIEVKIRCQKAY